MLCLGTSHHGNSRNAASIWLWSFYKVCYSWSCWQSKAAWPPCDSVSEMFIQRMEILRWAWSSGLFFVPHKVSIRYSLETGASQEAAGGKPWLSCIRPCLHQDSAWWKQIRSAETKKEAATRAGGGHLELVPNWERSTSRLYIITLLI